MVYRPPGYYKLNIMTCVGKAYPELTAAALMLTYITITIRFEEYLTDNLIFIVMGKFFSKVTAAGATFPDNMGL